MTPCPTCGGTRVVLTDRPGATSPRPCPTCDPPPHHNHDAVGVYAGCPACGTAALGDKEKRDA